MTRRIPCHDTFVRRVATIMNVQPTSGPLAGVEADWIALGVFEDQAESPASVQGTRLGDLLTALLTSKDVSGSVGDTTALHAVSGLAARSVLVVGLGPRDSFSAGDAFAAGVAVSKRLASKKLGTVAVALPEAGEPSSVASALTEGLIVGTRGSDLRKSEPSRHPFETLLIVVPPDQPAGAEVDEGVRRGVIVGDSVNLARDLVNTPPAEKPPMLLAARAREVAIASGLVVKVWSEARIKAERFGGLIGVSAGSNEPPAFVILEYRKGGDAPTLALVGKGVTFDSGGLSLKPSASMEDMKSDMTGAAVVLATLSAVARLKLPVNLRGYLILTENMTGGRAMKLGDVLTMRNGKTVEVLNTDAEGRLILADALSYAVESKPDLLLDLATLTGACIVALGLKIAGLFSNDDVFAQAVLDAAKSTGERAWRLPLDDDFQDALKSQVADLKNIGGKWGGAATAAKFLQQFVGESRWVHLDIAGPSWVDADSGTCDSGGTGCFVRTLIALIEAGMPRDPS
jgi:leucyl aminopeptidase